MKNAAQQPVVVKKVDTDNYDPLCFNNRALLGCL